MPQNENVNLIVWDFNQNFTIMERVVIYPMYLNPGKHAV